MLLPLRSPPTRFDAMLAPPTPGTLRQRAYERRQRDGAAVLRVECPNYLALVETLLTAKYISEADAVDRRKVEAAAGLVLLDWIARWQQTPDASG